MQFLYSEGASFVLNVYLTILSSFRNPLSSTGLLFRPCLECCLYLLESFRTLFGYQLE